MVFTGQKTQPTVSKVLKEKSYKGKPRKKQKKNTEEYTIKRHTHKAQQVPQSTLIWGD